MAKVFILLAFMISGAYSSFAQHDLKVARATASVIEPISIPKSVDINFENVAIIIAGSVELVPSQISVKSANIILPVTTGTFTAASFVISNSTAYTYKITVPQSSLEVTSGKNTMIVKSFDSDPILNAESDLYAGVYVSVSPMNVTVNYN